MRASDEQRTAPGAETIRALFGGEPTLILLDELSVYLRKVSHAPHLAGARDQLAAFLSSLFKAVESAPNAALVYTLAIGKDGRTADAYGNETEFLAARMAELESISARMATLLNPTEDDETAHVLRRRLFAPVDAVAAGAAVDAYRTLWTQHEGALSSNATHPETVDAFRASYPLHPEVLDTLMEKASTLANFQRVRGMLRLLGRTVAHLWVTRPADAFAIHLHHVDLSYEPIQQEIVTRLQQGRYAPALKRDIAGEPGAPALAQEIDAEHYRGIAPYATYVARTIFLNTLAFYERLQGITPEQLRFAMIGPAIDVSFVDDARKRFTAESAFLDDRPGVPLRFMAEANLNQVVRGAERQVEAGEVRTQLRDRIREIFTGPGRAVRGPRRDRRWPALPRAAERRRDERGRGGGVRTAPRCAHVHEQGRGRDGPAREPKRSRLPSGR